MDQMNEGGSVPLCYIHSDREIKTMRSASEYSLLLSHKKASVTSWGKKTGGAEMKPSAFTKLKAGVKIHTFDNLYHT